MLDQNSSSPDGTAAPPSFDAAVDLALFTIQGGAVHVAVQRVEGRWVLPGGSVREHEDFDEAATRELVEATGLPPDDNWYLEQLGVHGAPGRDPRKRVVTVAYLAVCVEIPLLRAGPNADLAQLTPDQAEELGLLRFDHAQIVRDALTRIRSNLEHTTLATKFLPPIFTIGDVREVYEALWRTRLDRANFQRNFRRNRTCFVQRDGPPPERKRRPGRPPEQWWSLNLPLRRGQPLDLLDHALMGPQEVWRLRRDQAARNSRDDN